MAIRPRNRWRIGSWTTDLYRDLCELCHLIDPGPVDTYLVGGIGLAVRTPHLYRNHGDLDLAVFTHDLADFARYLDSCGYQLAVAKAGLAVGPLWRADFYEPTTVDDILARPGENAVRAIKRTGGAKVHVSRSRVDFLDILLLSEEPGAVALHGYGTSAPADFFWPAEPFPGSSRIWLPNVQYKSVLPAYWPRQRADLDRVAATGGQSVAS